MKMKSLEILAKEGYDITDAEELDPKRLYQVIKQKLENKTEPEKGLIYFDGRSRWVISRKDASSTSTFLIKNRMIMGFYYGQPGILIYSPDDDKRQERSSIFLSSFRTRVLIDKLDAYYNIHMAEDSLGNGACGWAFVEPLIENLDQLIQSKHEFEKKIVPYVSRHINLGHSGKVIYLPNTKRSILALYDR